MTWLYFEMSVVALIVVALLVGYLFRRRFEYPLRGIFLTTAASTFFVTLVIWLALLASTINGLSTPNPVFFVEYLLAFSATAGILVAGLIAAGAAIGSWLHV